MPPFRYTTIVCMLTGLLFFTEMNAQSPLPLQRRYKGRERHRYRMTTMYYQNGQWKSGTVAICEIKVSVDSAGIPVETLQWLSQKTFNGADTTDETAIAQRVKPYTFSLHPKGSLTLPPITEPGMTGAVTDFHTFYVPMHAKAGAGSLRKKGDIWISSTPVKGDFANGKTILKGEDCILMSNRLVTADTKEVLINTTFLPPVNPCLEYYLPDMSKPVAGDTLNNIQMIMAAGRDKVNIQFGREGFEITSHLDASSGLLERAVMTNELKLKLRMNCSSDLSGCQAELPWVIYREITLQRLPD